MTAERRAGMQAAPVRRRRATPLSEARDWQSSNCILLNFYAA
jgi:hypothetical protein